MARAFRAYRDPTTAKRTRTVSNPLAMEEIASPLKERAARNDKVNYAEMG